MTDMNLNTLSAPSTSQELASIKRRLRQLEAIVQGQPIRSARIEDVSGSKVNNGTIVVKDGVDGSEISIRNASNVEIGRIDENGISIYEGDISIDSTTGDPILDGLGVVSENNFTPNSVISLNNARTTSSTTFVDVPSTSLSFTLSRPTVCIFSMSGNFANVIVDGETCSIDVALNIDGVLYPDSTDGFGTIYVQSDEALSDVSNCLPTWHDMLFTTLPSGSHTIKLQYRQAVGSISAMVTNTFVQYLLLGK